MTNIIEILDRVIDGDVDVTELLALREMIAKSTPELRKIHKVAVEQNKSDDLTASINDAVKEITAICRESGAWSYSIERDDWGPNSNKRVTKLTLTHKTKRDGYYKIQSSVKFNLKGGATIYSSRSRTNAKVANMNKLVAKMTRYLTK